MINVNTSKRWAAVRKSTGTLVRAFNTREAARSYKASNNYRFRIFDTHNGVFVR